jgi:hypothetical protein
MNLAIHEDTMTSRMHTSVVNDRTGLRALIDQATTDSVDESDEHTGLVGMIREEVACPFSARFEGEDVECLGFEWPRNGYGLNVVCRSRNGKSRIVELGELQWTEALPEGYRWIEAYLAWRELVF